MENLIIETGKFYKTRCGYKVIIYSIYPEREWYRNIHGAYFNSDGCVSQAWYPKGNFLMGEEYGLDIVSEWVEHHPAESWEVDKPILVSDDKQRWVKRHFANYKNGIINCWIHGTTSWTCALKEVIAYKFAKPAEEE